MDKPMFSSETYCTLLVPERRARLMVLDLMLARCWFAACPLHGDLWEVTTLRIAEVTLDRIYRARLNCA